MRPLFRKPRRITITVPDLTYRLLLEQSNRQGRSISNLAAFLLEGAVAQQQGLVLGEITAGRHDPGLRPASERDAA